MEDLRAKIEILEGELVRKNSTIAKLREENAILIRTALNSTLNRIKRE